MIPSLTGVHFLITYSCFAACDHCFLWGAPQRKGMTVAQIDGFLDEVAAIGTVTSVCAEGGEPFLLYPETLHFVRRAVSLGFTASALTNAFWVTSREIAKERIAELKSAGLTSLGISTDEWHRQVVPVERVEMLLETCAKTGLDAARMETEICGVMFRGRAAEMLSSHALLKPAATFTQCPYEQLEAPARLHLDCYSRVHLCQGLNVGSGTPAQAIAAYDPAAHPLVSLLLQGGPYALASFAAEHGFVIADGYADACHLCYRTREFLRPLFPELLGPDEMYGLG